MAKSVTLKDKDTNEALYPITLPQNVLDSNGNDVISIVSYIPTLQSVPTSSTSSYTVGQQTINFRIGQHCRVANANSDTGYDFYHLHNLVTEGNTTTAYWCKVYNMNHKTSVVAISSDTSSSCSITGAGNAEKSETIIYTNSSGSDLTVTVPTTYVTPKGEAIELTCVSGGYCEVNYLNVDGTIYARGL